MVKTRTIEVSVALAAATYGTVQLATAFVPTATQSPTSRNLVSLRGASSQQASSACTSSYGLLATGMVAIAAGLHSRGSCTLRKASAAAVESAESEKAPPPPFNPAKQIGTGAPLGFFDPLGFSKVGDEDGFRKLRIAEIKHGRVAMMAAVGAVIQHYIQFPGFENVPKGIFAVTQTPGVIGFAVLFALSGVFELLLWKDAPGKNVDDLGDYGNPLQLGIGTPLGEGEGMRTRELNNGRAAMIAALGIIVAELATGKDSMQQFGFS
jgi:hypothetical protein